MLVLEYQTKAHVNQGLNNKMTLKSETRLLKRCWKIRMATNNCPKCVWDYALVYEAQIHTIIARGKDGVPGLEKVTGNTVDITE